MTLQLLRTFLFLLFSIQFIVSANEIDKLRLEGESHYTEKRTFQAIKTYEKMLVILASSEDKLLLGQTHQRLNELYFKATNYRKSIEHLSPSLDYLEDNRARSLCLCYAAWSYERLGQYDLSIKTYKEGLEELSSFDNPVEELIIKSGLFWPMYFQGQTGAELEVKILGQGEDYSVEILMHPDETYNGVYKVQAELINERPWYQNDSERYLYFYNQAEGGEKSWSLDHRKPDGSKDWFSGGFTSPTGENYPEPGIYGWQAISNTEDATQMVKESLILAEKGHHDAEASGLSICLVYASDLAQDKIRYAENSLSLAKKSGEDYRIGQSYYWLGRAQLNSNKLEQGKSSFESAWPKLLSAGDYFEVTMVYNRLRNIYQNQDDTESMLLLDEQILALNPTDPHVNANLIEIYQLLGQDKKIEPLLNQMLDQIKTEAYKNNPSMVERCITILINLERFKKAKVVLQKLKEAWPDHPRPNQLMSEFYEKIGDLNKAAEYRMLADPGQKLVDQEVINFQLATLDGEKISLLDFIGKPVILNFWATW